MIQRQCEARLASPGRQGSAGLRSRLLDSAHGLVDREISDRDASRAGDRQAGRGRPGPAACREGHRGRRRHQARQGPRGAAETALHEADGIAIRSGTQLTAEVLENQPRLKAIVRAGVGVDNIDVPAATRQGIVVMNTPGGNTVSTAEHTMALMLALARNVAAGQRQPQGRESGTATPSPARSSRARRWAIVGLGRVGPGRRPKRALAFGMTVVGFDPLLSAEKALEHGIESVSRLDDLWPRCDFITLHTPLTAETRNLIDARRDRP